MTPQEIQNRMIAAVNSHGYSPSSWERDKNRPDVFKGIIGVRYAYKLMCGRFEGRERQLQLMRIFYGAFEPLNIEQQVNNFENKHKNA